MTSVLSISQVVLRRLLSLFVVVAVLLVVPTHVSQAGIMSDAIQCALISMGAAVGCGGAGAATVLSGGVMGWTLLGCGLATGIGLMCWYEWVVDYGTAE